MGYASRSGATMNDNGVNQVGGAVPADWSCPICGRQGDHACTLEPMVLAARTTGVWPFRRQHDYYGQLERGGSSVWKCSHRHEHSDDGLRCATLELQRMQGLTGPLRMPRAADYGITATDPSVRADVPGLTDRVWAELGAIYGDRCRFCGAQGDLERDHAVPLARGGVNSVSNIIPICHDCNQSKGVATEEEYLELLRRILGRVPNRLPPHARERHAELGAHIPGESRPVTLLRELHLRQTSVEYLARYGSVRRAGLLRRIPRNERQGKPPDPDEHHVAGVSFHQDGLTRASGSKGEWRGRAALVPMWDNPHDPHAVAVFAQGHQIGYLPRQLAAQVHEELAGWARVGTVCSAECHVFTTRHGELWASIKFRLPIELQDL